MAVRLNTVLANDEGQSFSPNADFFVQVEAEAGPTTVFDVLARMDAAAPWAVVDSISARENVVRYAAMPFVKIAVRNNTTGKAARAWSNV